MIYFDNAATANIYGNPSSPHALGLQAEDRVNAASEKLANIIGCRPEEIVYTSGGTESNNLALLGAADLFLKRGGLILTTPYEHPSVTEPLKFLKEKGNFSVIEKPVSSWRDFLNKDCVLASVTQVSNETGKINDLKEISALIKRINPNIILHSDGTQGFCKEDMPPDGVNLYSFSSHKIGGPPGMGGLVIRGGTRIKPLFYGGGQQRGLRSGTINVPGVLGMADAAEKAWNERNKRYSHIEKINNIISTVAEELPDTYINTDTDMSSFSPYILSVSFLGIKGETLVHMLSERDVYVSMGAACRTGKKTVSPLERMGYTRERAESAVRFSFSHNNTVKEAETVKQILIECVTHLRGVRQNGK